MQIILNEKKKELIQPVRRYDNQIDKASQFKKMATVKIAQKNAAVKIIEKKQLIEDQVAGLKLTQEKQIAALEKRKEELIRNIQLFCKENETLFKGLKGISEQLDKLLSGDVNYALKTMKPEEVGKTFDNLINAYATDSIDKLTEYYKSDFSKNDTFERYLKDNQENDALKDIYSLKDGEGNFCLDKVKEDKTQTCGALYVLKDMYSMVFNISDKIKSIKEDNEETLKKFSFSLEIQDERLNAINNSIQAVKKINKKMSGIDALV